MTTSQPTVAALRAGGRRDGWVADQRPKLSWTTTTEASDWLQAGARLRMTRAGSVTEVVLTGRESHAVAWPFDDLRPRERVAVSAQVTGVDGSVSAWSEPVAIRTAFLDVGEWVAPFIRADSPTEPAQPLLLRRTFTVHGQLRKATLYLTARGLVSAEINGRGVSHELFTPGWTSYGHRLLHETFDVTQLLTTGPNAIGLYLAGGWFTESFGFGEDAHRIYGDQPSAAAQLVLDYDDATEHLTTDHHWRTSTGGPIVSSGIYAGERWDTRRHFAGWSAHSFDDSSWRLPVVTDIPTPEPRTAPGVHAMESLRPVRVSTTPSGTTIVDFGQNVVGRVRLTASGSAGQRVTLKHAEVLEQEGGLSTRPLRSADATDSFILDGSAQQVLEARFTFHGFRYVELSGVDAVNVTSIEAVVIGSDLTRTGWFESSHAQLDRLHENVIWSMRGNFLSIPTDCPQRDERLGWTGDIQVFTPTASFLFDCESFVLSWLTDLRLDQTAAGGVVPLVIPSVLDWGDRPAAAWGDAAVIVPWALYQRFGDTDVLSEHFDSMRDWVDIVAARRSPTGLWQGDFQFGDWLDPAAPDDSPADGSTDPDLVATAHLIRSADLLAKAAEIIGRADASLRYSALADEVREAFADAFVVGDRLTSDSQTAYSLAIGFEIVCDDHLISAFGARLAELVAHADYRIGTGFVGTPLVLDALTDTGNHSTAERLLLQTECPSWLYPVSMGATTMWERWDSMKPDGTVNPGEMTSFNHYALGAVADWMHRRVAGLAPATPGYGTLALEPYPLTSLEHARATHDTPHGRAECGWRRTPAGGLEVHAVVPPNTTASVMLPGAAQKITVGSGAYSWITSNTIQTEGGQRWERKQ